MPDRKCIYKKRIGVTGELKAREYLQNKGYKIIKSNYVFEKAEVDIIAFKDNTIIFTEVKTRRNKNFGEPEESITPSKIKNIQKAAEGFLSENPNLDNADIRFDVITVMMKEEIYINHIENAF